MNDGDTLPVDTVEYDTSGFLDAVNHWLVVPVAGVYLFGMKLNLNLPVVNLESVSATLNFSNPVGSSEGGHNERISPGLTGWVAESSAPIRCDAGDHVSALASFRDSSNGPISGVDVNGGSSILWVTYLGPLP
jgi:hypothetical protein